VSRKGPCGAGSGFNITGVKFVVARNLGRRKEKKLDHGTKFAPPSCRPRSAISAEDLPRPENRYYPWKGLKALRPRSAFHALPLQLKINFGAEGLKTLRPRSRCVPQPRQRNLPCPLKTSIIIWRGRVKFEPAQASIYNRTWRKEIPEYACN
jgi:hypothetical protein